MLTVTRRIARSATLTGAFAALLAAVAVSPALADGPAPPGPDASAPPVTVATAPDTSNCTLPALTQTFQHWGDNHWYAPVPGQSDAGFDGTGWTLDGGASIVTTTLPDGSSGTVLDLPSGATATSPSICIDSTYPTARAWATTVIPGAKVQFSVSYSGLPSWNHPQATATINGKGHAWGLTQPLPLKPPKTEGWQMARFVFAAGGSGGESEIVDYWVDPYSRG